MGIVFVFFFVFLVVCLNSLKTHSAIFAQFLFLFFRTLAYVWAVVCLES